MSTESETLPATDSNLESAVLERYAQGAQTVEPALCCPTSMADSDLLNMLPEEIKSVDYGCGDPAQYVRPGDTVIDLGSGSGKACYVMAQKTGPEGKVIGVDFNDAMLGLSRKYQDEMADRMGYRNVEFLKARIQDLAIDIDRLDEWLAENPIKSANDLVAMEVWTDQLRHTAPAIETSSIDLVVSNCVLNLVQSEQKKKLFRELYRVLRDGGRAVISDIVCDTKPTEAMQADPELWSGCISGAFLEQEFTAMFTEAGFSSVEVLVRQQEPWQVIEGIEFRSMTVRAIKGESRDSDLADSSDESCCSPGTNCC